MEGGRVSHSWCICVVVVAMVGWMGSGTELVLGKHAGQSQVVGCMSGDAGAFPECVGNLLHPIVPPSMFAVLGRVESELVGLPGKA